MNEGKFKKSISDSISLLKKINIFKGSNEKYCSKSLNFQKKKFKYDYNLLYETAKSNLDYDILLKDDSIIKFDFKDGDKKPYLRYTFYQNPTDFVLEKMIQEQDSTTITERDDFFEDFAKGIGKIDINFNCVSFRYDLDERYYVPNLHSISHLHVGVAENIRFPVSRILTPLKFTIMIIKYCYYDEWSKIIYNNDKNIVDIVFKEKNYCNALGSDLWDKKESFELFFQ